MPVLPSFLHHYPSNPRLWRWHRNPFLHYNHPNDATHNHLVFLRQYRTTATIRITGRPFCKNQLGRQCFCSQERTDSSCQAGSVSQNQIRRGEHDIQFSGLSFIDHHNILAVTAVSFFCILPEKIRAPAWSAVRRIFHHRNRSLLLSHRCSWR